MLEVIIKLIAWIKRNPLLIGGILIAAIVVETAILSFTTPQSTYVPAFGPTPTQEQTPYHPVYLPHGKLQFGSITTNDFLTSNPPINTNGDVQISAQENSYKIDYLNKFGQFLIVITGSPFDQGRTQAENAFLTKLGITQDEACKLDVTETTPASVNPDQAGKVYYLSFCDYLQRSRDIQGQLDQQYTEQRQKTAETYPWLSSLPLHEDAYFTYFDTDKKIFVSKLYPSSNSSTPITTQVEQLKTTIVNRLRSMGVNTSIYGYEWDVTPTSE